MTTAHQQARVIGMIAVTHYDHERHCGLIGTYITPAYRGTGVQKQAKEQLFQLLPHSVQTLYAIIATHHHASLRAMSKLAHKRLLSPEQVEQLPQWIKIELWKTGENASVFQLDSHHYRTL